MDRISLFLIAHKLLLKVPFVLLPILMSVKIAKDRRKGCAWNLEEANHQMIGASLMILLSQFLVVYMSAEPTSPIGIGSALLLWYGVYRLARAIYRRRDLRVSGSEIIAVFARWFRSSEGLIIVGVGLFVSGLMGFKPSELWTRYDPAPVLEPYYGFEAYESVVVTAVGAMMIVAGILKKLPRRER